MKNAFLDSRAPFAIGVAGLGAVCLGFQDFALQWQSAPEWLKAVPFAANISALWLLATGIALMIPRTAFWGAVSAAVLFGVWAFVFHAPLVARQPSQIYLWLGIAETGCLVAAGLALAGATRQPRLLPVARSFFGLCAIVFGLSHFAYAEITAKMVPSWLPFPLAWAYLTGAGHAAAGLALLSGIRAKLAAGMEALMCGCFVVLLHVPRVIADLKSQVEWTMLCVATAIGGAAWVIRNHAVTTKAPAVETSTAVRI